MSPVREELPREDPRGTRFIAVLIVAAAFLAAATRQVAAGELCEGCSRLGSLSVFLASVEPEAPRVGDLVTFTYNYSAFLPGPLTCGVGRCNFSGGEAILDGGDPPVLSPGNRIVVQRLAAAAGTASVELAVRAESEERCFFVDEFGCQSYFQPIFIDVSSGPSEILIVDAPTATPTATASATPTATESATPQITASATPTPSAPVIDTQRPTSTESLATATPTPPIIDTQRPTSTASLATATPTGADTPQPSGEGDDDGCAITPAPARAGVLFLLAALPVLLGWRGRARLRRGSRSKSRSRCGFQVPGARSGFPGRRGNRLEM